MHENGRVSCLATGGRASNEELRAWLGADAGRDCRPFQRLFQAVAPLLLAYFEGKPRVRRTDLEMLTLETLVAVYQHRASYDPGQPFRAWLLDVARLRLADYLAGEETCSVTASRVSPGTVFEAGAETEQETMHRLRRLARRQVDGIRDMPRRSDALSWSAVADNP